MCPYLKPAYVSYLAAYRFDPSSQVRLRFVPSPASTSTATSSSYSSEQNSEDPERTARLTNGEQSESAQEWGELEIEVEGVWKDVILYEVPLMAIVSEAYFTMTETRWDLRGQRGECQIL